MVIASSSRREALLIAVLVLVATPGVADEHSNTQFIIGQQPSYDVMRDSTANASADPMPAPSNELKLVAFVALRVYQRLISPQDRPSCMFEPTCSAYAAEAIRRYGLLRGILMAADRLHRCNGRGRELYPVNPSTGKLIDPP
jgi:putative membrane protein insertion efficiency factor